MKNVRMSTPSEVLPPDHAYVVASKQIKGIEDMTKWEHSEAYQVNSFKSTFIYGDINFKTSVGLGQQISHNTAHIY